MIEPRHRKMLFLSDHVTVAIYRRIVMASSTTGSSALRFVLVSSPACSRRAGRCRWWNNPAQWI